jgi:predicted NAD/FAD-binding protein
MDRIRTNCAVTRVTRADGTVQVSDSRGETLTYDRVIFASHADETLAMLADATDAERSILGAFTYQNNHAVLHRDPRVMPKRKRCWASWVYMANNAGSEANISVTYWMNLLQSIDNRYPLFVTLNPIVDIKPEYIFDEHDFTHPVFTREAIAAQARIPELQGQQNTWFAGAYQRYGFHEDGLMSAVNVANSMGVRAAWQ